MTSPPSSPSVVLPEEIEALLGDALRLHGVACHDLATALDDGLAEDAFAALRSSIAKHIDAAHGVIKQTVADMCEVVEARNAMQRRAEAAEEDWQEAQRVVDKCERIATEARSDMAIYQQRSERAEEQQHLLAESRRLLQSRVTALEAGLREYGSHPRNCNITKRNAIGVASHCDCGFSKLLTPSTADGT